MSELKVNRKWKNIQLWDIIALMDLAACNPVFTHDTNSKFVKLNKKYGYANVGLMAFHLVGYLLVAQDLVSIIYYGR